MNLALQASTEDPTKRVNLSIDEVKLLLRNDPEFFIHFFMHEQLTLPVPEFHIEVFYEMTHAAVDKFVAVMPRAHAKTMLAKLTTVWYFLFSEFRFTVYASGSHDVVIPYITDIIGFMEAPNFVAVFGELQFSIKQSGLGLYKFVIPGINKTCILRGLGASQRVRGINVDNERPQLVIIDDLEDAESVGSVVQFRSLRGWFFGDLMKAVNPIKNKFIVCGNLIGKESILYMLTEASEWRSVLYGCIKADGEPLWADLWTIEKLRDDYIAYCDKGEADKWFAEMTNQPVPITGGIMRANEITYGPERIPEEISFGFLTCDPAYSPHRWADRAAICAHGWIEDMQQWQIVETRYWRGINTVALFDEIVEMASKWRFELVGIERAALQVALVMLFNHLCLLQNLKLEFLPVNLNNASKHARLKTFGGALTTSDTQQAIYCLTRGDFIITQQLLHFDRSKRNNDDDVADCASLGVGMIQAYSDRIFAQQNQLPHGRSSSLYHIATC